MQGFVHKHCTLRSIVFNKSYAPDLSGCLSHLTHKVLQGDAYTGNWLSAIRHTPKLARRMICITMSLVAELYPDKTHVL